MNADILLVDDDPKLLEIVSESLGRHGYGVRTAATGREALEHVATTMPHLVILDLDLPDMSGIDVLDNIRDEDETLPVLVLSGQGDVDSRVNALDGGADEFMHKPVSLRELHVRVDSALRRTSRAVSLGHRNVELESEIANERNENTRVARNFKRHMLSMRTLLTVSQDLNRAQALAELVKTASLTLVGELRVSSLAIFGVQRENATHFNLLGVRGFSRERFEGLSIDRTAPFVKLFGDAHSAKISRSSDGRFTRALPDLRLAVFEYAAPINVKGELKGFVFTGPKLSGEEYTEYDLDILTFVSNSIGIGMENVRLMEQLQVTYVATLRSLIQLLEAKDPYTRGHTERVASYSMALANRLRLGAEDLRQILFGSLLHDIGKMGLRDDIINKPGPLTADEWVQMKAHPVVGAQIVEKMEFLSGAIHIVRHHHESYDGKGYPDGLAGENIPLIARIVTVADSFDAMTTDRPYRKALTIAEAMRRIEKSAGTQFDPHLAKVFIEYMKEKGREAPAPVSTTPASV
ncbi:MAG TPA: HD domain-containing phosphohydrolase [Candidatus Krumholzibacteria bacterium]|nr:HD domain-containing phosphohydrolase [Candidatus Krumholzibacteria bacterium]